MDVLPVGDGLRLRSLGEESYVVERLVRDEWVAVGEAALTDGVVALVVAPEHRRQGIGRRVLLRLVDRARVLGHEELQVPEADEAAAALLRGVGFVGRETGPPSYVLRLPTVGGRPRW